MQKKHIIGTIRSKVISENGHQEFVIRTLSVVRRNGLMIKVTTDVDAVTWSAIPLQKGMTVEVTGFLVNRNHDEKVLMIDDIGVLRTNNESIRRMK